MCGTSYNVGAQAAHIVWWQTPLPLTMAVFCIREQFNGTSKRFRLPPLKILNARLCRLPYTIVFIYNFQLYFYCPVSRLNNIFERFFHLGYASATQSVLSVLWIYKSHMI